MQIETPPTEKRYERPTGERRGLILVHTGDGKGKSTAAFGLALRAFGRRHVHGKQVRVFQFMKVPSARFGDVWQQARAAILDGAHFLVVLDEITYPLIYGWLPLDDVLQTLRERPRDVHVCLTGRRCPPELIEIADTVTEMQLVKHAFKAGVPAQRGIED